MADAAEVLPLPEEEPANEAPQGDDSAAADDSGKDVSFGTFLTVGPKEYRNVTIVGYDNLRGSVRAVRRSGDSVENIQIPYEQYKTIIEAQKESDKATGRTTKKNLSKAVRGYFGKSVSLEGKTAQVIGYDAQSDEVLVSNENGKRWMKTGEMLRGTQSFSNRTPLAAVPPAVTRAKSRDIPVAQDLVEKSAGTSVSAESPTPGSSASVASSGTAAVSGSASASASGSVSASIPVTAPDSGSASISIRETREALKESRPSGGGTPIQNATATITAVAAAIPPANTGAAAVVAAAQNVLAAYGASATKRDGQIQQISNQISEASNRINDLQQRSRESQAGGNEEQAGQYERQIVQAQSNRTSLLNQQTDLQVAGINENNQASKIVEAVKQLVPDAGGAIPDEKVSAVERLLPNRSASKIAPSTPSVTGAVLQAPKKPALPRTFAPGIPSRTSSARPNPSARTPKPLRPLGGSLGAVGGQTQRAVDFNAAQQYDRGAPSDSSRLGDSSEEALATEGGRPGYSGPLDLPERKPATYAAGADDEPEAADIYGAQEEAGRAEMKRIHSTLTPDDQSQDQGPLSTETSGRPAYEEAEAPAQAGAPSGPTPEELARASALQQIMAQDMLQRNQQQDQAGAQGSAAQAESTKKKIQSAKQLISDLIDAFDALHGLADVLGLLVTIAHVNLRLVLTIFKKDFPFIPRANFPFECTIIGFFDLMVCLSVLSTLMGFVVILAALVAALSSATFGLSEFFDLF